MASGKLQPWFGAMRLIDIRYLLTPITVDWVRHQGTVGVNTHVVTWRSLWLFGIRVARWRVSDD